jgi:hypothetical protein
MDLHQLERQVFVLKVYVVVVTAAFILGTAFTAVTRAQNPRQRFGEIDVERINVIERDGRLRLTISNLERASDPVINGKTRRRIGGNAAGLLFFNDDGEERGGLVYSNNNASLTFDKYRQNEVLRLAYSENAQGSNGGLSVIDRPNQPPSETEVARMIEQESKLRSLAPAERQVAAAERMKELEALCVASACGAPRLFSGKMSDRSAAVVLSDAVGRPRIRMAVTAAGAASLDFIDAAGKVIESFP